MHSLRLTPFALVAVLVIGLAAPAHGIQIADYLGYAWLTAGFPPTVAGESFDFVGAADAVDPLAGVNLATEEVTFHISGLEYSFTAANDPAPGLYWRAALGYDGPGSYRFRLALKASQRITGALAQPQY